MKKLKFHRMSAKNFLCFGPEGIEIKFDDFDNIVFIRGENKDVKDVEESSSGDEVKISSNGSGKSSLQEILSYGLFGKTIKKPTAIGKDDVINNLVGKDCKIELEWDQYRVVRTRKKNSLRFWSDSENKFQDDTELTTGSMDETQLLIEQALGLTYEAFVNICIFTDDQSISFLEANAATKREIVENLLSLSSYREKQDKVKKLTSETSASIKVMCKEYDLLQNNVEEIYKRINQAESKEKSWKINKQQDIENLKTTIKNKKDKLGKSNHGEELIAYNDAQNKIISNNNEIIELEKSNEDEQSKVSLAREKEDKLREMAQAIKQKSDSVKFQINEKQAKIKNINSHIQSLNNHEHGAVCGHCYGVIDEKNIQHVVTQEQKEIDVLNLEIKSLIVEAENITKEAKEFSDKQSKIRDFIFQKQKSIESNSSKISILRKEVNELIKIKEPKADSFELLLSQEIQQLESNLQEKIKEYEDKSPFEDIIESEKENYKKAENNANDKQANIQELEDDLKYYQYWQNGFGEKGIRKIIVDGIIPELNNRIAYWLQFLIDNKITLKFDNEFKETIERNPPDGDPYIYHAMSAGQRRRMNLAVSQAFADIMMISSGTMPSLVFLDEVTTNIDPCGVQGIYNMIQELCSDKQVFITTHDKDLIKMLETVENLNLIHDKGFTKLKK